MALIIPNTFGDKTGSVQLGNLDNNFTYLATQIDALALSGGSGGATGAGGDQVFSLNSGTVTTSYTLAVGKNAMSVGPITVASGVTVTVPSGQRWVVL